MKLSSLKLYLDQLHGEKECSFYVKNGQCEFGATCKFHRPQPANVQVPAPDQVAPVPTPVPGPAIYQLVQTLSAASSQQYGVLVARPPLLVGSYAQGPYGPVLLSPGMVPISGTIPGWSPYPAPVSPVATQRTVGSGSLFGVTRLSPSAPAYTGPYQPLPSSSGPSSSSQKEHPFPERPGKPECQYFMKNGDCKFGSSCRYHHPKELAAQRALVVLSPVGLPLRPGEPPCAHYTQRGECKFGHTCKFDHPMDMPVAPYPVGSSVSTLGPSSSSSELRPELISGSGKGTSSTRMSSSLSTSGGSVGSVFSESIPYSSIQQSSQNSGHAAAAA